MHRSHPCRSSWLVLAALLALGAREEARSQEAPDFETQVRPIITRSCGGAQCHIGLETSGGNYTSYESIMASRGAQYVGPVVVPGDPDASPLIDKVSNETPRFGARMPLDLDPLSPADIDVLRRWIAAGALPSRGPQRGDFNGDGGRDLSDAVGVLGYLFQGGAAPRCPAVADADGSGSVDITDALFLLAYLFQGGAAPEAMTSEEEAACRAPGALSFANLYDKVLSRSCAFSSCHGSHAKGSLSMTTLEEAYANLVGVNPANGSALAAGMLRVAPGEPARSFLLTKLGTPGPGQGNRMPANSTSPLSDRAVEAIRQWIAAGAPRDATVPGATALGDEPLPQTGGIPQPPVPENGLQIHLTPFTIRPGHEREILWFAGKPFQGLTGDVWVKRIDIHMSEQSHHFIIYEYRGATDPAPGPRDIQTLTDILGEHRFVMGSQQSFFSLSFPPGVGLKFAPDTRFDLNSHYLNLDGSKDYQGEVYVNIFFAEPGSITTVVKPIFDINLNINVPPNATRTTKSTFPSFGQQPPDAALGFGGKVVKETHVYALSSHMHRHGKSFRIFLTRDGKDVDPPQVVYENLDWDDPSFELLDPPLVLKPGMGLRYETTHTYDDPPSVNVPPLKFGLTSEDEMAILLGFYAVP